MELNLTNILLIVMCLTVSAGIFYYGSRLGLFGKKKSRKSDFTKEAINNRWNARLLMGFLITGMLLLFVYSYIASSDFLPEAASVHGEWVDELFWGTTLITGVAFILTQVLLFYFPFRYQHGPERKAVYYPRNIKLELTWTIIPAIVFLIMNVFGFIAYQRITATAPADAVELEIMAQQFNWSVRYPGKDGELGKYDFRLISAENDFGMDLKDKASQDDFVPLQLHIPKGRTVVFKIRTKDVIHSVYMPHFRVKQDAVPGMPTRFHFVARYTTEEMRQKLGKPDFNYELACAELCGYGHFAMKFIVVVDEEADFWQWYQQQKPWISAHAEAADRSDTRVRSQVQ